MTFEEWWKDSEKSVYWCNNPSIGSLSKCIAQSAWEAAQPKWTLCKDRLPNDGVLVLVYMPQTDEFNASIMTGVYISENKEWDTEWYDEGRSVIAWMPLPEAPDINKNNKERTK